MQRIRKKTVDGVVVEETPWTLEEELKEDARESFIALAKKFTGDLPPTDNIDEWRARYKPEEAVIKEFQDMGIDPANVPVAVKKIFARILDLYMRAVLYSHGALPGEK